VPVKITDQVASEATRNHDLPWAAETCSWIVTHVVGGRVEIVYTDTGFDHRQQFDAWIAGGMDPSRAPRSRNLGEASILELMTALENEARGDKKAIYSLMSAAHVRPSARSTPTSTSSPPARFLRCSRPIMA
jgi:hypothetical protein